MRQRQVYAIAVAIVTTLFGARGSLYARPLPITQPADTHRVAADVTESQCAAEWQPINGPPAEDLHSVAYGNGLYLAAGSHGTLLTSPDGFAWTPRTYGTTYQLNGLAYGGGQYVAVDNHGSLLTSPDGMTWTTRISSGDFSSVDLSSVAYGSGRFVVVGSDFGPFAPFAWTTLTSTDGVSWNRQKGGGFVLGGVTYGNGLFVAVGNESGGPGAVVTSLDGTNWTRRSAGTSQYLGGVTFGGGQFVAWGSLGSLLTSTDGIEWTEHTIDPGTFNSITYGAGQFVGVGSDGRILTSPDGTAWTTRTSNHAKDLNAVTFGGGQFLAVGKGGSVLSSEDAQTWTNRAWWTQTLNGVAFGAGSYVAVGEAGTILTSPDGSAWTSRMSGRGGALWAIAFGGNLFVTVGASGTILTSVDGVTWTNRSSGTTSDLYGIAYGGGQFVAVGSSLTLTSPDGITWTAQPGGATSYAVAWGRDRFVAVGPSGQIRSSTDGHTWTYWYSGLGTDVFHGITYGAGVYVAVGAAGIIMTSEDGSTWTARASGTTGSLSAVAYGGGRFIAVGCGFLRISSDGATWTSTQTGGTSVCSTAIVYGAGQFLTAGGSGRIARSACAMTFETLSVATAGSGRGRVTSSPSGISCGATCSWNFEVGTEISLFPVPDAGFTFLEWQGDCTGASTCRVVMNQARSVSAVFGTPTAPGITRFLPVVLDVSDTSIRYTTEMALTNNTLNTLWLSILYTSSLGTKQGSGTVTDSLAPGEQKKIADVLSYLRDMGLAIPPSGEQPSQGGTLLVTFQGNDAIDPRLVSVTARTAALTTAPQPLGRAGLAYSGLLATESSTSSLTLYGLRSTATDRTNVAVFNTSSEPVTLKVTVYSGFGDGRSVVFKAAETLPPYGWLQYGSRLILDGSGITRGWVTIERTSTTGSFSAYGVINDFATNDGSFVLPFGGAASGSTLTVPVLSETPAFRSELILANNSASTVTLTLDYAESQSASSGPGGTVTVQLAPWEEQIIPEAIDYLRTHGVNIGAKDAAPYVGALRIMVSGTTTENVFAGARTASQSPAGGQFGLFTPCVYSGQEASTEAYLYGLRADTENRSNVAVVNTGSDATGPVLLQLQAYDGNAGGVPKGNPVSVTLSPGQWAQPGNFFKNSGVANGWVKVTRMSGTAPWIAYGVVNDGGNPGERTGDGAYVSMVK